MSDEGDDPGSVRAGVHVGEALKARRDAAQSRLQHWRSLAEQASEAVSHADPILSSGHLTRINGLVMEAAGLKLPLGSTCKVYPNVGAPVEAEVVGFSGEKLFLMPSDDLYGLSPGAQVMAVEPAIAPPKVGQRGNKRRRAIDRAKQVPVGESMLGRVVDGVGRPLDGKVCCARKRSVPCKVVPTTRWGARPLSMCWMSVCAPSTGCSPSGAGSAWVCSPVPALANPCSWA